MPSHLTDPPCPKCGLRMRLGYMESLDEPGHERRIYECLMCKRSINVVVDFEGDRDGAAVDGQGDGGGRRRDCDRSSVEPY
jgi:hypothetical protein